jgi:LacI family repressor for deo operon, udp, cdd, tsx, nupC, and nupG
MDRPPRLRDVAELAGVSQATVSRVVNDKATVAPETRRRVLQALDQLGYRPVGLRSLRPPAASELVGLIVPELDNPIFPAFAQELENALAAAGCTTVLGTATPSGVGEAEYIDLLLEHQVSGIVIVSGRHADTVADHGRYLDLLRDQVPLVLVNGRPGGLEGIPAVSADDAGAMRAAVAHLAGLGHRRIGMIAGPRRYVPSLRKIAGYIEGLEEVGLPANEALLTTTAYSVGGGHVGALELLGREVTAVVCSSDAMALGAIRAAREVGLVVPRDLSVVGFDDSAIASYVTPGITTSRQPVVEMAADVVARLRAQIDRDEVDRGERLLATQLIVRSSTGEAPELG